MRPLHVVVLHEDLGRGFGLLQVGRPIQREAFLLIGSVVAFDKAVLLGMVRSTKVNLDAQTGPKTDQGSRKITARWTAHPARIAIERNAFGAAVLG